MKVTAILASNRKGNTYLLLKWAEKILSDHGISMDIVRLYECDIKDCQGCDNCVLGDGCRVRDDMPALMEKMIDSDGIIMATPVYNNNVSGKMKMFIDKTVKWSHSPVLMGKTYMGAVTTSSSGLKFTTKYLSVVGVNWGAHPVGSLWASKRTTNLKNNRKILLRFIKTIRMKRSRHRPSLGQVNQFQKKKVLAQTVFPNDLPYWKEMGWMDKPYYYPCAINPLVRMLGSFSHWMLLKILTRAAKKYADKMGDDYGKLKFE